MELNAVDQRWLWIRCCHKRKFNIRNTIRRGRDQTGTHALTLARWSYVTFNILICLHWYELIMSILNGSQPVVYFFLLACYLALFSLFDLIRHRCEITLQWKFCFGHEMTLDAVSMRLIQFRWAEMIRLVIRITRNTAHFWAIFRVSSFELTWCFVRLKCFATLKR